MSKHFKLLVILLSVILCFSAFSITAMAIDADGDGYDDETGELIGGDSSDVEPDPVYTDPYVETDPVVTEPYAEPDPVVTEPYAETDPVVTEPVYDPNYNQSSDYDYNNDYIADPPSYVGGGQSYVAPISTAPSVPLIDANENIDVNELSSNDWKDISANLKNASNSSDGDDFSFIQNNNSSGDNGYWLLITGVVFVLLSLAGITYFFVSGASLRKKLASTGAPARSGSYQNRYRASDDYDDGYRVSRKEEKKKAKRSSRYDTAEINLPKKNNSKNRYR